MTIDDIETAHRAKGLHFFDRDSMRFFDSRILEDVFEGPGGVFFVTSEKFHGLYSPDGPRLYTIRKFDPATGHCRTYPGGVVDGSTQGWQEYKTAATAKRWAAKAAKGEF